MDSPIDNPQIVINGQTMIVKWNFHSLYRFGSIGIDAQAAIARAANNKTFSLADTINLTSCMVYHPETKQPIKITPDEIAASFPDDMAAATARLAELAQAVTQAILKTFPAKSPTEAGTKAPGPGPEPIN